MALAGLPRKRFWTGGEVEVVGIKLDKLRLSGSTMVPGEAFCRHIWGLTSNGVKRTRNFGTRATIRNWGTSGAEPRTPGVIYWQHDEREGGIVHAFVVEFNPQKLDPEGWSSLRRSLAELGVSDPGVLWVERYDGAVGFNVPRSLLLLHDPVRKSDHFSVGTCGPETERTGFRKGSRIKHQLYDKRAEAESRGDASGDELTRYEVQVLKPTAEPGGEGDLLRLVDLPGVPWPGGDVEVRAVHWDPQSVADPLYMGLAALARGLSVRCALGEAKRWGWNTTKRERFLSIMLPVIRPDLRSVWAAGWREACEAVARLLQGSVSRPLAGI
jgi:hypothetical protein